MLSCVLLAHRRRSTAFLKREMRSARRCSSGHHWPDCYCTATPYLHRCSQIHASLFSAGAVSRWPLVARCQPLAISWSPKRQSAALDDLMCVNADAQLASPTDQGSTCVTHAHADPMIALVLPIGLLQGLSKLSSSAVHRASSRCSYPDSDSGSYTSYADHYAGNSNGFIISSLIPWQLQHWQLIQQPRQLHQQPIAIQPHTNHAQLHRSRIRASQLYQHRCHTWPR